MFPRTVFFFFFLIISPSLGSEDGIGPSETECRPYIEKALQREVKSPPETSPPLDDVGEPPQTDEAPDGEKSREQEQLNFTGSEEKEEPNVTASSAEDVVVNESQLDSSSVEEKSVDEGLVESVPEDIKPASEEETNSDQTTESTEGGEVVSIEETEVKDAEPIETATEEGVEDPAKTSDTEEVVTDEAAESIEVAEEVKEEISGESIEDVETKKDELSEPIEEEKQATEELTESTEIGSEETVEQDSGTASVESETTEAQAEEPSGVETSSSEAPKASEEAQQSEETQTEQTSETVAESEKSEEMTKPDETIPEEPQGEALAVEPAAESASSNETGQEEKPKEEESPEEELIMEIQVPDNLRSREHMSQILRLDSETEETETLLNKIVDSTLKELKKLYDAAIKPLEILYKYRDLSNRHFGDPEIFSKPLILFMGPWSGGKSTIINYLLENEYKMTALRTGAEPSPAYFNIVMYGEREEVLDGTQLAADWTFSGLQKFGQGLLDRLRGLKLKHPLLEKVNIVEIPGILEIRKQVERLFPFNDACQWFIDRADIIFLVYDPSKLDVGPETEAILDQLKGREMQTRIILNKADQVKPEELMRVQGTLIWNISPLMSSTEPPVMYSTSLWSLPYEVGSPTRLLYAQERAFLRDLRGAIDKRVENKIASARRFAVRVRNHAKMVDCYLTTYYNHKTFFGNKKKVSDDIIEHPQNYHIYEGLSTLTNISRYDLPDPDVYKDFFRLNPIYEFQQLAATCTYFKGCPINRLDVAIAYDLPELVGKYKKSVEEMLSTRK